MRRSWLSNPEHTRLWDDPSWSRCERLIKAFEDAWRHGQRPILADYLSVDGQERLALLVELVHADMEFRLKAGESIRVETYLAAYPELAADRRTTLELILGEHELRQAQRGGTNLEDYILRFPDFGTDLHAFRAANPPIPEAVSMPARDTPDPSGDNTFSALPGSPAVPGYDILGMLGRGGMGVVYKARETNLGRLVALKFLPADYAQDPARLERFLREARTTSALNHPHICTIHALGQHDEHPFIVMEFIEGRTLRALTAPRLEVEDAARLIGQAARALAAAHAAGVIHRDIKPENIMVRADGYVKVLDFGLARRLPTLARFEPGIAHDTDPGALLGTLAYMSPEQTNDAAVDSASDIFSLGIVFYQLVTGQHPFEDSSAVGVMHAIATREPVLPSRLNPEVPATLERLIGAMLHKDARLRLTADEVVAALATLDSTVERHVAPVPTSATRLVVPRQPELAALHAAFARAEAGQGCMICVAGEPGIGKTTLVEGFLDEVEAGDQPCLVARGHCSERLANAEAYLTVIDALTNLLRRESTGMLARLMKTVAASWYSQVVTAEAVRRREAGGGAEGPDMAVERAPSQQALLREFAALLQEASHRAPVVLFFDDLHWADVSTVDLLAHVGRQCAGLRVLVIVTYRPTELLLGPHPFHHVKLELQGKRVCTELPLDFLSRDDINSYLTLAFPGHALPADFADLIHARTEGSPLFMTDLLCYLRERGVITEVEGRWTLERELPDVWQELPESVRSMVQRKLDRLDGSDRRLLAAASVQGAQFDSAMVAAALKLDAAEVEERLQALARVHGLVRLLRDSEFPDHTLTQRYGFVHILYQQALYAELSPSRRAAYSLSLARHLESHHGPACPVVAAELACLYEVGRDFGAAAVQFHRAAQNAACLFAHRDAIALAQRGLRQLQSMCDSPERAALELTLQTTLGLQLQIAEGYAAPAAKQAYERARELCPPVPGSSPFPVLWGLWLCAKVGSELRQAQAMADELLVLARQQSDPNLALQAFQALGMTAFCRGEPTATLHHVEQAMALYDRERHLGHAVDFGQDPGVICKAFGAVALWLLGHPEEAVRQSEAALRMSQGLSPTSQAVALHFAAMLHQLRRDIPQTRAYAEATSDLAAEHGLLFWQAAGTVLAGWARAVGGAAAEGISQLRQGITDWCATGSVTYMTYYLGLLAELQSGQGQAEEAGRLLEEALALVLPTGEGLYEAELYRLRGELRLRGTPEPAAKEAATADFRRAWEIARWQRAKGLELRAALCLARHGLVSPDEARSTVADALAWFAEGFQTADLREAVAFLARPSE